MSEQGYFVLPEHGLATTTGAQAGDWSGGPVLVGEVTCPRLACLSQDCDARAPEDGGVAACFAHTVTGATLASGCLTFDTAGQVVWALEPIACQPDVDAGVALVGDRFVFQAVSAGDVVTERRLPMEELAAAFLADGGVIAVPEVPGDLAAPRDELRIVEGGFATPSAVLVAVESGAVVAVEGDSLVVEDVAPTPEAVRVSNGWLVDADPGATAMLRLQTNAASFDVASIQGVPLSAAASMTLYAFYWSSPDAPGSTAPAGVHALVRDGAGRPLDGAPVEWTLVQGDVALSDSLLGLAGGAAPEGNVHRAPWLLVSDACRPPSARVGTASALLRARLGDLQQDLWLTWTLVPDLDRDNPWLGLPSTAAVDDEGFTRDPACLPAPACGCAAAQGTRRAPLTGACVLLVLAALLACAKRRPS